MSLSDYIKYLRAVKGGLTPWEIAEGSGVPAREIHLIEVKHRRMGEDDQVLEKLAAFFGVPAGDLTGRREAYRKRLTFFLEDCHQNENSVVLRLENGEEVRGTVDWYSREAVALKPEGDAEEESYPYIVQRGYVADWRRAESPTWEVSTT
jgi:hypothetical protein